MTGYIEEILIKDAWLTDGFLENFHRLFAKEYR